MASLCSEGFKLQLVLIKIEEQELTHVYTAIGNSSFNRGLPFSHCLDWKGHWAHTGAWLLNGDLINRSLIKEQGDRF